MSFRTVAVQTRPTDVHGSCLLRHSNVQPRWLGAVTLEGSDLKVECGHPPTDVSVAPLKTPSNASPQAHMSILAMGQRVVIGPVGICHANGIHKYSFKVLWNLRLKGSDFSSILFAVLWENEAGCKLCWLVKWLCNRTCLGFFSSDIAQQRSISYQHLTGHRDENATVLLPLFYVKRSFNYLHTWGGDMSEYGS